MTRINNVCACIFELKLFYNQSSLVYSSVLRGGIICDKVTIWALTLLFEWTWVFLIKKFCLNEDESFSLLGDGVGAKSDDVQWKVYYRSNVLLVLATWFMSVVEIAVIMYIWFSRCQMLMDMYMLNVICYIYSTASAANSISIIIRVRIRIIDISCW